jgi:hypothetical protein
VGSSPISHLCGLRLFYRQIFIQKIPSEMKTTNFFHNAPPWVNNSLGAVLTLLLTIDQIAPQITDFFNLINCEPCIDWLKKILAFVAIVLTVMKIFMKAEPKIVYNSDELDNQSGRASKKNPT